MTTPDSSAPALQADSDSGLSQIDGITNINTPTLIGTAPAGATIALNTEQGLLGITTADSEGNWTFTVGEDNQLPEGTSIITAQTNLDKEEESEPSDPLTLVVDTTKPEFTSAAAATAELLVPEGTLGQNGDVGIEKNNPLKHINVHTIGTNSGSQVLGKTSITSDAFYILVRRRLADINTSQSRRLWRTTMAKTNHKRRANHHRNG